MSSTRTVPVREGCRQWLPDKADNCWAPAAFIVWGKLFDRDELGPRCADHMPERIRDVPAGVTAQWAVFDLRGVWRQERVASGDADNQEQP